LLSLTPLISAVKREAKFFVAGIIDPQPQAPSGVSLLSTLFDGWFRRWPFRVEPSRFCSGSRAFWEKQNFAQLWGQS